jgi:hypothetical protein
MYASYIEVQFKPGKTAEAMEMARQMKSELGQMGMKQFIVADKGDDSSTLLALYDTAEDQEAAGPKAAELLGRLADLFAAPPERKQVEVPINFSF